jgi:hypothetical protein
MKNPFPGLNPYLQMRWQSAHLSLIVYLNDLIQASLPVDLLATIVEKSLPDYRPDVHIHDDWEVSGPENTTAVLAAPTPVVVKRKAPIKQRFIEIVDTRSRDRVITVIEILSPTNKQGGSGIANYQDKQRTVLEAGTNLVEIDLLRGFKWTPMLGLAEMAPQRRELYRVAVSCAGHRPNRTLPVPVPRAVAEHPDPSSAVRSRPRRVPPGAGGQNGGEQWPF